MKMINWNSFQKILLIIREKKSVDEEFKVILIIKIID